MASQKCFNVRKDGEVMVVELIPETLSGFSDHDELSDQFSELMKNEKPSRLLVNFSNVKMAASDAIGVFIRIRKEIAGNDGEIKLCAMSPIVRESFRVLNLDGTLFEILDTEADGIAAF